MRRLCYREGAGKLGESEHRERGERVSVLSPNALRADQAAPCRGRVHFRGVGLAPEAKSRIGDKFVDLRDRIVRDHGAPRSSCAVTTDPR